MVQLAAGWLLVVAAVTFISLYFLYLYSKDRDKRKLMFSMAFLLSSIDYLELAIGYIPGSNLFLQNLYYVAAMPLMVAIFLAVTESFYRVGNFDKMFNIFFVFFIIFLLMVMIPFPLRGMLLAFRQVLAAENILLSGYMFLKKRKPTTLMFLLSLICFTVAGVGHVRNLDELSIFSYLIGYTFLTLVFTLAPPYTSEEEQDVEPYFSLKKKLEKAEKALRESEARYRKIVESIREVIMLIHSDGTISYLSPACKKVLEWDPQDLVGKQPWKIIYPEDFSKVREVYHKALKGESGSDVEHRIVTKHGKIKWVSLSWSPILEGGKPQMIVNSMKDITWRKLAEEKLREKVEALRRNELATLSIMEDLQRTQGELNALNKELENKVQERTAEVKKLLEQKEEFIRQLGHDLKTPLTPLNALLPIVKNRVDDPKLKELLEISIRNVNYMKNLVTKTLQLARLNVPSELELEDTNLLEEVDAVIANSQTNFEENNIRVERLIDDSIIVKADRLRLGELFDNLISNAVKYSPNGGTVTIGAKEKNGVVTVFIKDTGIGMTKEQMDRIFDEFYKADESRHDFDSSGLGLSICKRIVEKHGGRIWVESQGLGKGSTFYFTLKAGGKKEMEKEEKINKDVKVYIDEG